MEKDRQNQINSLEEKLSQRRKKISDEVEQERLEELDKIEKEHEARKRRLVNMEDAEAILKEFRRQEDLVALELEKDRKGQMDALAEKMRNRRRKNIEAVE